MTVGALLVSHGSVDAPWASLGRITTVPVVVATEDMPEGAIIEPAALLVAQWPKGVPPVGAYSKVDSVAGRVTRLAIYKGEAIVPGRLALERIVSGGEVGITPGKRAYGIRINDVASLTGMVRPNSRVDIMLVVDDPEQQKQVAKLFMENMRVLAIGAAPERAQNGRQITAAVASIEVTPEEAEWLAIAAAGGSLQLAVRGSGDNGSINTAGADARAIKPGAKRARNNPLPTVESRPTRRRAPPKRAIVPTELPPLAPIVAPSSRLIQPDSFALKVFRAPARATDSIPRTRTKRRP